MWRIFFIFFYFVNVFDLLMVEKKSVIWQNESVENLYTSSHSVSKRESLFSRFNIISVCSCSVISLSWSRTCSPLNIFSSIPFKNLKKILWNRYRWMFLFFGWRKQCKFKKKKIISVIVSAIVFETLVLTCLIIEKGIPDSSNSLGRY